VKVRIEFDVDQVDAVTLLKRLNYHTLEDGEITCTLEEVLDAPVWDCKVEVLEFVPETKEER